MAGIIGLLLLPISMRLLAKGVYEVGWLVNMTACIAWSVHAVGRQDGILLILNVLLFLNAVHGYWRARNVRPKV